MLKINPEYENERARSFCQAFACSNRPKYVLGRNKWARSIAEQVKIDGFIDDVTSEKEWLGRPIIPMETISQNALVVQAILGKPFIAEKRVRQFQFDALDYFSFFKYSGMSIKPVLFWEGMIQDIKDNFVKYKKVYNQLQDNTSKNQFYNIVNFRRSYDINYMRGFESKENQQYFEKFLNLNRKGESFVDVGAYDGYSSKEFIKNCSEYEKIFVFEPEEQNMKETKKQLSNYKNIKFFTCGLSNQKANLCFDSNGSGSKISNDGQSIIKVNRLDDLVDERISFIKMDIEGAEQDAIDGAYETIRKNHPKLAISVYHRNNDFWKIPEKILGIRSDYHLYLRHYTEGVSETIMFFVPISGDKTP